MANINLVGQAQCEINNVFVITATKISVSGDRPVTVKYGAQGPIGTAKGAEKVSGSLELAVPTTGLEIDLVNALNSADGFTFSFPIGAEKHALLGTQWSKRGFSNAPEAGDTTFTVDFVATEWIRIR